MTENTQTTPQDSAPDGKALAESGCYADVAAKYDELAEIFARHKLYDAAAKCQENADTFRRCGTLVAARRAGKLNEA